MASGRAGGAGLDLCLHMDVRNYPQTGMEGLQGGLDMDWNIWNQEPDERGKFDGWWYLKQIHFHTDEHRHAAWLAWQAGREELLKEQGEKNVQVNAD